MSIIIKNNFWTGLLGIEGITLWPFIIIVRTASEVTINHEKIHIAQQQEMWILPFYIQYLLDYRNALKGLSSITDASFKKYKAYAQIRFEQESYKNQNNLDYLKTRKKNAWKDYTINSIDS